MDREKEWSLIIEDANTKLHLLFKNSLIFRINKFYLKNEAHSLFFKVEEELKAKDAPKDLIIKSIATMKRRFVDWYNQMILMLEKESQSNPIVKETIRLITDKSYQQVTGNKLKQSNAMIFRVDGYDLGSIDLKDSVTTQEYASGQAYMDDYVNVVKKAMKSIAGMNLVMKDINGRKLSVRNLAEMTARFENTKDRIKELKDKGIEYVVASSHINASARCQIWQGKIFHLDVDPNSRFIQNVDLKYQPTPVGKIDGLDYYSLEDAMAHGFLGYNCRHRLVKYTKGMSMFNEYPANRIEKERNREIKQRELERKIRYAKKEAYMAVTPEDRKKWTEQSKYYQEKYHRYCQSNDLVEIPWRTRISMDERGLNVDYDGDGLTYGEYIHNIPNNGNNFNNNILLNEEKSGKINIEIDEFTPCLKRVSDGKIIDTKVSLLNSYTSELDTWEFDWKKEIIPGDKIFQLKVEGDDRIQGLIKTAVSPKDSAVIVKLVESAPFNNPHNKNYISKEYMGVGGHLFAEAVKQSYECGYDGFVYFTPKTNLIEYYIKELGATPTGFGSMYIDERSAKVLYERYYKSK